MDISSYHQSSTEAECHSIVHTAKENQWVRDFIRELKLDTSNEPTTIYQDNMGAIALMKGGGNHKRSKHLTIEFDALREYVRQKEIDIKYIETEKMPADMLTKSLGKFIFQIHRDSIMRENGMREKNASHVDGCGVERRSKDKGIENKKLTAEVSGAMPTTMDGTVNGYSQ